MVVVTIVGLLAAIAMPSYRRITLRSKATAVVNDIRTFAGAFSANNLQNGAWPAEVAAGVIPAEVTDALPKNFALPTPIGGHYDWDNEVSPNGFFTTAAITIVTANGNTMTDDAELVELIDSMYDDGVLTTGTVRLGATNALVFILEQ